MDGLESDVVNYLNSFTNYEENKEIIAEFRRMMDNDPETKKRYEKYYNDPIDQEELANAIFPFEGAWYLCFNGSVMEGEELKIWGPYTPAEIFHIIRMERYLEEMDPSYYHEVDYWEIVKKIYRAMEGGTWSSGNLNPQNSAVRPLPRPDEPQQKFSENDFGLAGKWEADPIRSLNFSEEKLDEMARDFFDDEEKVLLHTTGDPAEDRREAMRRLLRIVETAKPVFLPRPSQRLSCSPPEAARCLSDGRSTRALMKSFTREERYFEEGDDDNTFHYQLWVERQQEADWDRVAKSYGVRTRKADALFYSSGQAEPPLSWEYVASEEGVDSKEYVLLLQKRTRAYYMRNPFGVRGVYRLYWILL